MFVMDEYLIYASAVVLLTFLAGLLVFLFTLSKAEAGGGREQDGEVEPAGRPRVARQAAAIGGRRRAGGARHRLAANRLADDDSEGGEVEAEEAGADIAEEKIGAKKQRKLEEKAARKAQREFEQQEREERKRREEKAEALRKEAEKKREAEEAAQAAEEQKKKEEKERQEHEEYLKLKAEFTVDEEGIDVDESIDKESLLQQFVDYIKTNKVVMLEDLAAEFKIKTQDAIDRVKTLQDEGILSGVIDDRGKFIYITSDEYESVAKFIKQCGRISITELSENMNRLINISVRNETFSKGH